MKFGKALDNLEAGQRVARGGWNGGTYVQLVLACDGVQPDGSAAHYGAFLQYCDKSGNLVPYMPTYAELFASNWTVVS